MCVKEHFPRLPPGRSCDYSNLNLSGKVLSGVMMQARREAMQSSRPFVHSPSCRCPVPCCAPSMCVDAELALCRRLPASLAGVQLLGHQARGQPVCAGSGAGVRPAARTRCCRRPCLPASLEEPPPCCHAMHNPALQGQPAWG